MHCQSEFAVHNPVEMRHDRAHVLAGTPARPTGSELIALAHMACAGTTFRNRPVPDERPALVPVKKPTQHVM
ncbi:MAG TPA: hypothetical protein VIK43_10090 [Cellulomonas sp.]